MKTPYEVETLIAQLGGPKIFAMAFKSCAYATSPKTQVTFLLKGGAKCSHLRVTLEPSDLYTVEFLKVGKASATGKTLAKYEDVYADMLVEMVEKETGLYLSL